MNKKRATILFDEDVSDQTSTSNNYALSNDTFSF